MSCIPLCVRLSNEPTFIGLYGIALFDLALFVGRLGGVVFLSSEFLGDAVRLAGASRAMLSAPRTLG
jgi:hypothetical protein